jgi:hypothetical protein
MKNKKVAYLDTNERTNPMKEALGEDIILLWRRLQLTLECF